MLRVKKVEYVCEYKLKVFFSNGKTKIIDFEKWISEDSVYLKPLRNLVFFKKVDLDDCKYSICWPNGADFSPDVLYESGREVRGKPKISRLKKTKNTKQIPKKALKAIKK
jgi:hypothetical protein